MAFACSRVFGVISAAAEEEELEEERGKESAGRGFIRSAMCLCQGLHLTAVCKLIRTRKQRLRSPILSSAPSERRCNCSEPVDQVLHLDAARDDERRESRMRGGGRGDDGRQVGPAKRAVVTCDV